MLEHAFDMTMRFAAVKNKTAVEVMSDALRTGRPVWMKAQACNLHTYIHIHTTNHNVMYVVQ